MRGFFDKKKLVLTAALCIVLFVSAGARQEFPVLRGVLLGVLSPVSAALSSLGNAVSQSFHMLGSFMYIYEENEALKKEIAELKRANTAAVEIWAENTRLRALLNFQRSQGKYVLLPATVIGFNPGGLEGAALIDRGQKDGVRRGMAVVTASGLVGNITEIYRSSARVQLVLHPKSAVGGIVQRPASRASGIVSGNAGTPKTPNLLNLARDADVLPGDTILTSGFGSIYPKGIVIGVVSQVSNAEGGLLKYAVIEPSVDFSRLEEVLIITNTVNYKEDIAAQGAAQ